MLDGLVAAILLALPLTLFWSVSVGDRTLIPADNLIAYEPWKSAAASLGVITPPHNMLISDLLLENYPWKEFIRESLAAGRLPLWNPYLFAGTPFLAAGQSSAIYPFALIYYLLPLARSYGVFIVADRQSIAYSRVSARTDRASFTRTAVAADRYGYMSVGYLVTNG